MYYWRKLSEDQRAEVVQYRRIQKLPKHSPPHFDLEGDRRYLLSAACYEHKHVVGESPSRMTKCEADLLAICQDHSSAIYAWCLLPNHYHILLRTSTMKDLRKEIGLFNGRSSFEWNGEDDCRGRKVWHNCFERGIRSARHYFASLNYVLNNAVHHGYVDRWQDWPWSNAREYLDSVGRERAAEIWREYPVLDYGKKWDVG
jgi:putative transposase